eukprot:TRINITY_DN6203_c0_g1_i1.p1 TRINITY_DN6203_c0_g1~~TRINITY_DN6203_c0_g1_i1.p1  ORF type:complete len:192 (-),score=16.21 TRINITY_DN6203_c0_g1_i1:78-653(-)
MAIAFKINLLPLLAIPLGFLAFIFCIVGLASSDEGWAKNDGNGIDVTMGWERGCAKTDGSFCDDLEDSDQAGGAFAFLGCFIAMICSLIICVLIVIAVLGAFGMAPVYKIVVGVGSGLCYLIGCILCSSWIIWLAATSNTRDNADLDPDYAFGLAIVATIFFCCSSVCLGISSAVPLQVYPSVAPMGSTES